MTDTTTTDPQGWACVKCGANHCAIRPGGGVRCLICSATYHLELDQPVDIQEAIDHYQAELARITAGAGHPQGGSRMGQPLLAGGDGQAAGPSPADLLEDALDRAVSVLQQLRHDFLEDEADVGLFAGMLVEANRRLGAVQAHAERHFGTPHLARAVRQAMAPAGGQR